MSHSPSKNGNIFSKSRYIYLNFKTPSVAKSGLIRPRFRNQEIVIQNLQQQRTNLGSNIVMAQDAISRIRAALQGGSSGM